MYVQKVSKVIGYVKFVASYCETIQIYGVNLYNLVNNFSLTFSAQTASYLCTKPIKFTLQ